MQTAKRNPLPNYSKVLIGLALGGISGGICQATLGADSPQLKMVVDEIMKPTGQIFLKLIFMVVIPLLVSALALGIIELGSAAKIGKIGMRALGFTVMFSGIAVMIAIAGTQLVKPGVGLAMEIPKIGSGAPVSEATQKVIDNSKKQSGFGETISGLIPSNPFEEMAKPNLGGILPLLVFSVLFGIALLRIEDHLRHSMVAWLQALKAISEQLIVMAMKIAPIGVFALIFTTAATYGWPVFIGLGKFAGLVLILLAIQLFLVYPIVIKQIAKRDPVDFFRKSKEVFVTAFATSSSNATLPTALRVADQELKLPKKISAFVLTVGATANQNGTALFEGVVVLFLAQVYGLTLGIGDQLVVVGLCILAGIGTAGVPGGSWPMIAAICVKIGLPAESIGLLIGIDRILDMSRTVVNVMGDITIAACVSRGEEFDMQSEVLT